MASDPEMLRQLQGQMEGLMGQLQDAKDETRLTVHVRAATVGRLVRDSCKRTKKPDLPLM